MALIAIVTVSDRASQGVYEGKGGPAILACLREMLSGEECWRHRVGTRSSPMLTTLPLLKK